MTTAPIADCTVGELLHRAASRFGDGEAVVSPERNVRWSFRELDRQADQVASACLEAGLEKGDRAVVWSVNSPEWVALQYGLARAGVVLVTANTSLKKDEISFILSKSRARALFFGTGAKDNDFQVTVDALDRAGLPRLELLVGLDGATAGGSVPLAEWLRLGVAADPDADRVRLVESGLDRDEVINMQYTSGTTGFPKGVMLSHRNLVQNAAGISPLLGLGESDRLALVVPLFHCFGCVIGTLCSHNCGMTMVLNDQFQPDAILDTIEQERCTCIYGVPTMFVAELEAQRRKPRDLSSLRVGIMAGATCPEAVVRAVADELHVPGIVVGYGLTEASPGVTFQDPADDIERKVVTVGRPMTGVEVRITDPETLEAQPIGETGELWVRGENIMIGYDDEPQATRAAITPDGWLRTGDLAVELEDGNLQIAGRIKELIIRGGENISPAEIEDLLRSHPAVADAAAFPVHSEFFGEDVAAAVRLVPGGQVDEDQLKNLVRQRLSRQKTPTRILFLEQFPLTGSGKVQKFRLREMAEQGPEIG